MNPIQTRFSNVEALRHSEVDVQELKAHGQIEVGGKCYDIRAAEPPRVSRRPFCLSHATWADSVSC